MMMMGMGWDRVGLTGLDIGHGMAVNLDWIEIVEEVLCWLPNILPEESEMKCAVPSSSFFFSTKAWNWGIYKKLHLISYKSFLLFSLSRHSNNRIVSYRSFWTKCDDETYLLPYVSQFCSLVSKRTSYKTVSRRRRERVPESPLSVSVKSRVTIVHCPGPCTTWCSKSKLVFQ